MWPAPDNTRLVFDVTAPVEHNLFTLDAPDRIVIDIKDSVLDTEVGGLDFSASLVKGIRTAKRDDHSLRVVLDLKQKVHPKSFVLRPNGEYGHRLVIDLEQKGKVESAPVRSVKQESGSARDIVVAIDAGHGGDDPGAIGPHRTKEKDVVLAIARRLEALLKEEPGIKPVMIRDGDYFIPLRKRVEIAKKHRADLFISIHADSFRDHRAKGASVYTISTNGASSEQARQLAEKENASDLIGGVSLHDKDDLVASVLLDLSMTATIEASADVASRVLRRLRGIGKLHKKKVERAGFRVLKSVDLPSILVETAFISNPDEERQLRSADHQYQLAKSIRDGVRSYFRQYPPPGTYLAGSGRKHVISRGETLSGIAQQYRVSMDSLRSLNGLSTTRLKVGEVLHIPSGG